MPLVLVFAGPNGSGKSTITSMVKISGMYINADEIKKSTQCDDLEAAQIAEKLRNNCVDRKQDFTFETVLSTQRNMDLLRRAKKQGFFIKAFFVLTHSSQVNIARVKVRKANGGHDVPIDKIVSRYERSLAILPELIRLSDVCNVYDNTAECPQRIFSKKKDTYRLWETAFFSKERILALTGFTGVLTSVNSTQEYLKKEVTAQELTLLKEAKIPVEVCKKDQRICIRFEHSLQPKIETILQQSVSQRTKK